jgi:hypothetical protein
LGAQSAAPRFGTHPLASDVLVYRPAVELLQGWELPAPSNYAGKHGMTMPTFNGRKANSDLLLTHAPVGGLCSLRLMR